MSVNIIGAGLAGLSAALTLAENGIKSNLISAQQSERAQSVMAEGGINACLNTMGEDDSVELHFEDTMNGGVNLADPNAVKGLCEAAPEIVQEFARLGVPFEYNKNGIIQRNFGGQKKKRTAYVKSSTGKMLMTALIDAVRRFEVQGLVTRYPHHSLDDLMIENNCCTGVKIADEFSGKLYLLKGAVIFAAGGMNGLFEGMTTGSTQNNSDAAALLFDLGVEFANLEFIQYHPTTIGISGKRLLISEAARGEGGRLFVNRNGVPWYFMEETYPVLGNLMPRDVVSAEMVKVCARDDCGHQVYLDMTALDQTIWKSKLSDLREQLLHYLQLDPAKEPVPVAPGIHFFMGGVYVDEAHKTSLDGLYAAGECACQYHGANRLGGNSLLGAVYGGRIAAQSAMSDKTIENDVDVRETDGQKAPEVSQNLSDRISKILYSCLKIIRSEDEMLSAREQLRSIRRDNLNRSEIRRLNLASAAVECVLNRRESRGAHKRLDYPETLPELQKQTIVRRSDHQTEILYREIPKRRENET